MKEKYDKDFTDEEITEIIREYDENEDGQISFKEFVRKGRERLDKLIEGFKHQTPGKGEDEEEGILLPATAL